MVMNLLLPMWEYQCPNCGSFVERDILHCPKCLTVFDEMHWRIPPRKKTIQKFIVKYFAELINLKLPTFESSKAMSNYAHNVLAPKLGKKQQEFLFQFFTTIFSDGWETAQDFTTNWTGKNETNTTVAVTNALSHHGLYCMSVSGMSLAGCRGDCYKTLASGYSTIYARVYVRFASLFTAAGQSFYMPPQMRDATGNTIVSYPWIQLSGGLYRWEMYNGGADVNYADANSFALQANTWYCVETKTVVSATVGELHLYVNGVERISKTGINTGTTSVQQVRIRTGLYLNEASARTAYFDCIVVADARIGCEVAKAKLILLGHKPHTLWGSVHPKLRQR